MSDRHIALLERMTCRMSEIQQQSDETNASDLASSHVDLSIENRFDRMTRSRLRLDHFIFNVKNAAGIGVAA
jgi:hypothetical protein